MKATYCDRCWDHGKKTTARFKVNSDLVCQRDLPVAIYVAAAGTDTHSVTVEVIDS